MKQRDWHDNWDISISGISIWPYFRFDANFLKKTLYAPKINITWRDIKGLITLIFMPFLKYDCLIFISSRKELLSIAKSEYINKKYNRVKIFVRSETENEQSDVFFIESIRYVFRIICPVIFRKLRKTKLKEIEEYGLYQKAHEVSINNAIGDFYFNRALKIFLKNKKVYFSNCVVPQIERAQSLHDSIEIQHGVIHSAHPDYAFVPHKAFQIRLLVWGEFWSNKVNTLNFGGEILIGPEPISINSEPYEKGVCFFSTPDIEFSHLMLKYIDSLSDKFVHIQRHPRDYFDYANNTQKLIIYISGRGPSNYELVFMHDSTLIYEAKNARSKFFYIKKPTEDIEEVKKRLFDKYHVTYQQDYDVIASEKDLSQVLKTS